MLAPVHPQQEKGDSEQQADARVEQRDEKLPVHTTAFCPGPEGSRTLDNEALLFGTLSDGNAAMPCRARRGGRGCGCRCACVRRPRAPSRRAPRPRRRGRARARSEEHTSELQSLMRISYAVFCLKKKTNTSKK